MGITAGSLARQIEHIERIAVHDDGAEPLDSYLVELDLGDRGRDSSSGPGSAQSCGELPAGPDR